MKPGDDAIADETLARISRRCVAEAPEVATGDDARDPGGRRRRRRPVQPRSRHTVAVILEASREVFDELGFARATTNHIAERAGVSVGSLYQYFPDKAALLEALGDEHHDEVHAVVGRALERLADPETSLDDALRVLLVGLLALHEGSPGLHRVLAEEVGCALAARRRKDEEARITAVVARLLAARPEVRVADPALAAHLLVQTVEGVARWLGHDAPDDLDGRAAADELVRMLVSYLTSEHRQASTRRGRERPAAAGPSG